MNSRDWFTVGLRLFGIWQLIAMVGYLLEALSISADVYRPPSGTSGLYLLFAFEHFFLAVWLLKFAPNTARMFYPDSPPRDAISDKKRSDSGTPTI